MTTQECEQGALAPAFIRLATAALCLVATSQLNPTHFVNERLACCVRRYVVVLTLAIHQTTLVMNWCISSLRAPVVLPLEPPSLGPTSMPDVLFSRPGRTPKTQLRPRGDGSACDWSTGARG